MSFVCVYIYPFRIFYGLEEKNPSSFKHEFPSTPGLAGIVAKGIVL